MAVSFATGGTGPSPAEQSSLLELKLCRGREGWMVQSRIFGGWEDSQSRATHMARRGGGKAGPRGPAYWWDCLEGVVRLSGCVVLLAGVHISLFHLGAICWR